MRYREREKGEKRKEKEEKEVELRVPSPSSPSIPPPSILSPSFSSSLFRGRNFNAGKRSFLSHLSFLWCSEREEERIEKFFLLHHRNALNFLSIQPSEYFRRAATVFRLRLFRVFSCPFRFYRPPGPPLSTRRSTNSQRRRRRRKRWWRRRSRLTFSRDRDTLGATRWDKI